MKNLGNSHFEEEWKKALEGAELVPEATIWRSVELSLVLAENNAMKKQVVLYRRMAAASVVVLFLVAGYFILLMEGTDTNSLPLQSNNLPKAEQPITNPLNDTSINAITQFPKQTGNNSEARNMATINSLNQAKAITKKESTSSGLASTNTSATKLDNTVTSSKPSTTINHIAVEDEATKKIDPPDQETLYAVNELSDRSIKSGAKNSFDQIASREKSWSDAVSLASIALVPIDKVPEIIKPTGYSLAYSLADALPFAGKSKKQPYTIENTWTSVGFAAGSFVPNANPNAQGANFDQANDANLSGSFARQNSGQVSTNKSQGPGRSMTVMLAAGKRIFKKWVMQGGLSYLSQTSSSNSDIVTVAPANQLADFALKNSIGPENTGTVTFSTPTVLNNSSQFISIPLQAGFMLVDKRFGIQINGGLSPDFFLRNTVYDETNHQEIGNTANGGSTFRGLSLSGLGSLEMSYGFFRHYRVSIQPGFKYSITSPYHENLLTSGKPFAADIALRFRYIFN